MVLGFKERFKQPILIGTKIHTIREDKQNRWREGRIIHMATGLRTPKYHCFRKDVCHGTQRIEIFQTSDYLNETIVKVDDRQLSQYEIQQLSWNDGFANLIDFWLWFSEGFKGKIIHWTNKKY